MGRGKPFVQPLKRLVRAGVVQQPTWMQAVEATRPPFVPVSTGKPPKLEYPEDRLRSIYLLRNPEARRVPVNLKAKTASERHIADKFVSIQMEIMEEQGIDEEEAYLAASRVINAHMVQDDNTDSLYGPLSNPNITDEIARLYLASVKDSQRDQALFKSLSKKGGEEQ